MLYREKQEGIDMKKLLFILGILCTALMIAGCGSETAETTEETTQAPEESAAEETTETAEQQVVEETVAQETTQDVEEATETVEEAAAQEETGTQEAAAEETTEAAGYEGASTAGCTDSDGGKNYELAGSMVDARGVTDYDRCSENENFPERLYESYCEEDGSHGRETYDCPSNKCSAGACVTAEATE